jgi:acetyl-CoA C-acetyltransferase
MNNRHAYLLAGTRTPFGRINGQLSEFSGLELGTLALNELSRRHPMASMSDGALLAMVMQAGQSANPARTIMYRSKIGSHIPASTLNAACPAGIDCIVDATRRIERGEGKLYIVGGIDSSTRSPWLQIDDAEPISNVQHSLICAISGLSFAGLADRSNIELSISRKVQDEWALLSHQRATKADFMTTGELFPVQTQGSVLNRDEGIRPSTSMEKLSALKPVAHDDGTVTAGNAPQLSDGASVGLVGSLEVAKQTNTEPLARIVDWGYSASADGSLHLQPAHASRALLARAGLKPSDIDLWEINEAFAGVVLASIANLKIAHDIVNPNGGAIALGHPNSATAFRLVLTLAHELRSRNLKRGIATLCGAGGQGIALLIENENTSAR